MTAHNVASLDLGSALRELSDHTKNGSAIPDVSNLTKDSRGVEFMPTSAIKTRLEVFQPRTLVGQIGEEYAVMGDLKDALERNGVEQVNPVIVWWSGQAFFCVDGHHRIEAIKRFNKQKKKKAKTVTERRQVDREELRVPVTILSGTLSEALGWSTRDNGKSTITLKSRDKSDWAWKQAVLHWGGIIEDRFVMARRCKDLHVSERLLKKMKSTYKRIIEKSPHDNEAAILQLAELGWANARALSEGRDLSETWDDEKREAEVQKVTHKLISALGPNSFRTTKAEITGEALLRVSERFLELAIGSPEVAEAVANAATLGEVMVYGDDDVNVVSDY